jgi:hypothetical protein
MNERIKAVVVSYVPMMVSNDAGRIDLDFEAVSESITDCPDGVADGCVWLQDDDGSAHPCLLYAEAEQLAGHLKLWSENEPGEWFQLVIGEYGGRYGMALIPKFDKVVERFRLAFQLRNGYPLPDDMDFEFVFTPLHFASQFDHTFTQVKPAVKDRMTLSVACVSDLEDGYESVNWNEVLIDLGTFEVIQDGPLVSYLINMLRDLSLN